MHISGIETSSVILNLKSLFVNIVMSHLCL